MVCACESIPARWAPGGRRLPAAALAGARPAASGVPSAHGRSPLPAPCRRHRAPCLPGDRGQQGAHRSIRHAGAVPGRAHRHGRRRRRPSPVRDQEQPRAARPVPQRQRTADGGVGQCRTAPDGAGAVLRGTARQPQQHRARRRSARALRPLLAPRMARRAHRAADQEHALGGVALAHPVDGAAGADEHRRVRGVLLRRVHGRLPGDGALDGAAARVDGAHRPGAHRRSGHRPALLDSGHTGGRLLGRAQHSRRRDVYQPGARLGARHAGDQHPESQPRHRVRRRPPAVRCGQDRGGGCQPSRRPEQDSGHRRGGALRGRVLARVQPADHAADARYPVRRENRRIVPTSPRARRTRKPTTATAPRCTGTWW